jgi:cyclopropane-fatty-acyl-phospholipid synthase
MGSRVFRKRIEELLNLAGIQINGDRLWDIQIHNDKFYGRVLIQGALGLGESYMDGWWDCDALDEFFNRALRDRLE